MLRFSANLSLLFTELPLLERFQAAKDNGFDAVEVQFPYQEPVEQLKSAITDAGVELVLFNIAAGDLMAGGEGISAPPHKRKEFINAVGQALDYASVLQPNIINVLAGRSAEINNFDNYLNIFKGNLGYAAESFSAIDVKIVFEAVNTYDMPMFLVHDTNQVLDIIADIDHPNLFMQYDIYHMQRMGVPHTEFISKHSQSIGHYQFADAPGRGEPGSGEINFGEIFTAIEDSGYTGHLGAEYNPTVPSAESLGWLERYGQKSIGE